MTTHDEYIATVADTARTAVLLEIIEEINEKRIWSREEINEIITKLLPKGET